MRPYVYERNPFIPSIAAGHAEGKMSDEELKEIEAVFEQEDEPDQDWYVTTIERLIVAVRQAQLEARQIARDE